jgi:hypothetical protein
VGAASEAEESGSHGNNIGNVDELPWKITNIGDLKRRGKKKNKGLHLRCQVV